LEYRIGMGDIMCPKWSLLGGYNFCVLPAYHGEKLGTFEEHRQWLALFPDDDPNKTEESCGYRKGLQDFRLRM
jgi:hypothetical protein